MRGLRTRTGTFKDTPAQGGEYSTAVVPRPLTLPNNPDGDGYMNLEECLRAYAAKVEGR